MENFTKIPLLLICVLLLSCQERELEPEADLSISDEIPICDPAEEAKTVTNVRGIVLYDDWFEDYIITRGIPGTYDSVDIGLVCELPEEYRRDGLKIEFSGTYHQIEEEKKKEIPVRIIGEEYFILEINELQVDLGECKVGYGYGGTVAEEWNEKRGVVKAPDEYCPVYTIVGVPGLLEAEDLFPCNLPEDYKVDGLEVVFSGFLFEIPDDVDICSYAFQLTKIKPVNDQ